MKRSGVTIASRKGYFALRDPGGVPVNAWEAPALGALEQQPLPNAFPVRAGALRFPERDRPGLVPVVVEFKTAPLTFQPSTDGKTYTSDFAVIVRFLDKDNQVARKVSQHYEVNGPIADIDSAKQGDVIFYREPELPAGVYTMETIVFDSPSGKSSVRLSTVEVTRADPTALRMSSLVLVKRGEKVPEKDRRADNPLLVRDIVLSPNLGDAVSKASKEVGFYFAAYPVQGRPAAECIDRASPQRKTGGSDSNAAVGRRRERPHPAGRPVADCRPRVRHLRTASRRLARQRSGRAVERFEDCGVAFSCQLQLSALSWKTRN